MAFVEWVYGVERVYRGAVGSGSDSRRKPVGNVKGRGRVVVPGDGAAKGGGRHSVILHTRRAARGFTWATQ